MKLYEQNLLLVEAAEATRAIPAWWLVGTHSTCSFPKAFGISTSSMLENLELNDNDLYLGKQIKSNMC